MHIFLTSALVGGEWPHAPPVLLPGIYWIGGWVGPRTGDDEVERRKFFLLPGPLSRPARSQLL
jgi:hypothetical protein